MRILSFILLIIWSAFLGLWLTGIYTSKFLLIGLPVTVVLIYIFRKREPKDSKQKKFFEGEGISFKGRKTKHDWMKWYDDIGKN